jgi:hypothetical protein
VLRRRFAFESVLRRLIVPSALVLLGGCSVIVDFDRTRLVDPGADGSIGGFGGGGASGGQAGSAGRGGEGGTSGAAGGGGGP